MISGLFGFIKVLLVVLLAAAVGNELRVLVRLLGAVIRRGEAMPSAVQKAGRLWTAAAVSVWITAILIFFEEKILTRFLTWHPYRLLYATGLLLLVMALLAGGAAVAVSMSRVGDGARCGDVLQRDVLRNSVFAILIWISAWAVS